MIVTWEKAGGMKQISGDNGRYCPTGCPYMRQGICRLSCANVSASCPYEKPGIRELIAVMGELPDE